jgi:transcriptional regulator with XRE-family HTH domain
MLRMEVQELLRTARLETGLTQAQLAERLGTTQSAIARWESGQVSPRVRTLERLLEGLGYELEIGSRRMDDADHEQIRERLRWAPIERLRYLVDMVDFEARVRSARARQTRAG